jgi:putative ABC transport system substrate-binding protein
MRRRAVIAGGAAALPGAAAAQTGPRVRRIGVMVSGTDEESAECIAAVREALAAQGYVEGRNLRLELRGREPDPDRLRADAAEFAALGVEVIVTGGTTAVHATLAATTAIPVVLTGSADPVLMGFAQSLARPGGRVTGLSILGVELLAKRIEILAEIAPSAPVLAAMLQAANPGNPVFRRAIEASAAALGRSMHVFEVRDPSEFDATFDRMTALGVGGLFVIEDPLFRRLVAAIANHANRRRIATVCGLQGFVVAGGLATYSIDYVDLWRRAAGYVARILGGAAPGDLPIEQPTRLQFAINLKTARQIGLTVSPALLARADEVIE